MAYIRIKDLPAFSGTIPSDAVFALETNEVAKKVDLATLRGAVINIGPKTVTANGEYQAPDDGLDGYSPLTVAVPNTYTAADEGKVVQNGALVQQTSRTIALNGEYDTTLNDQITVNVPQSQTATVLYRIYSNQGGVWVNTGIDVENYDEFLFASTNNGIPLSFYQIKKSEIGVYSGGTDIYTTIFYERVSRTSFNVRIYNGQLNVSYSHVGMSSIGVLVCTPVNITFE